MEPGLPTLLAHVVYRMLIIIITIVKFCNSGFPKVGDLIVRCPNNWQESCSIPLMDHFHNTLKLDFEKYLPTQI